MIVPRAVAAVVLSLVVVSASQAQHRAALLIGNAGYERDAELTSPVRNVRVVRQVLRDRGFNTTVVANASRDEMYEAIERFIKGAPINGTALIYFSGYVVPGTTDVDRVKLRLMGVDGDRQGLPVTELADWLYLHCATTQNVIVVDGRHVPGEKWDETPPDTAALPGHTWLGRAIEADSERGSAFARAMSDSRAASLATLLPAACTWTRSTCREAPLSRPASRVVSPPHLFPLKANAGDEWVSPDGTVFCYCPPRESEGGFWMGKYEVPLCKWPIPGQYAGIGDHRNDPTTQHAHKDVLTKLAALTATERKAGQLPANWEYALPSPEQWEYAARAGLKEDRWFTDSELDRYANVADRTLLAASDELYSYADPRLDDGRARLAPVGSYMANPWGLHDVYGNVWEQTDAGVLCGGSWLSLPGYCRATIRKPALRFPSDFVGLRIVVRPVASPAAD